jgi:hypothetical protein
MAEERAATTQAAMQSSAPVEDEKDFQHQRLVGQATAEGHDTDAPSDIGHVLDERDEAKRRHSIADQRQDSLTRKSERTSQDIEKGTGVHDKETVVEASETLDDDANVVWWDGPDDPANPYNWPPWKKVVNCGLISALTFITPLASSIFAPGVPELMEEFRSRSTELAAFVVSVYVLGFASGPLVMAPMSEIYGRVIVYHICNFGYIAFVIGCALAPSLNALIVFRFLSGIFGSCPLTNGGGSIADMFTQENRAVAMVRISHVLHTYFAQSAAEPFHSRMIKNDC